MEVTAMKMAQKAINKIYVLKAKLDKSIPHLAINYNWYITGSMKLSLLKKNQ